MSRAFDLIQRRDSVTVPKIWVAVAVSLLVHALAMWQWRPDIRRPSDLAEKKADQRSPMIVQIVPERRMRPPAPRPAPQPTPPPVREMRPPQPKATPVPAPRVEPRPPVLSLPRPDGPPAPSRLPAPPAAARPAERAPSSADLMAYVEAQRRARSDLAGPAAPPQPPPGAPAAAESENARANRLAAANLGLGNKPTMGADPRRGGGIFEVQRMGYDYAEFAFYGWNKEMRRNTAQVIDVRKGNHSDIKIAVVRRMIAIIRDHEQNDFSWESHRLGRVVTLSARQRDSAGLEGFLMREFFEAPPPARR